MKYRLSTVLTDTSTAVLRSYASTAFAPLPGSPSIGLSTPHSSRPNSFSSKDDTNADVAASLGSGSGVGLCGIVGRTSALTTAAEALFLSPVSALRADKTVNAASAFSLALTTTLLTNTLAPVAPFSERVGVQFVARGASFAASPVTADLITAPICTASTSLTTLVASHFATDNSTSFCHAVSSAVINNSKSTYSITPGNEVGRPDEARPLSLAGSDTAFLAPRRPSQGVMTK